jgi:hypothetical protein
MAETVVSGGTGGGGGGGGTGGTGLPRLGAATVSGTTVILPVSCSAAGPCALQLKLVVVETVRGSKIIAVAARKKARHRTVVIGRASVQAAAGSHTVARVPLNKKGLALLKHHSPLHALLVVTASGKTVAKKYVTLRSPRRGT